MIRKSTWIIILVFLALLAGTYLWQRKEMQAEAEATPTASAAQAYLFNIDGAIKEVRIERVGDRVLEMKQDGEGNWMITWPEGLETDNETAGAALAPLASLPVVTTLAQTPDLDAMGLAKPAYRIMVVADDGKSYVANIGKMTPTQSGYYILSSNRNITVVSTYSLDPLLELIDAPPVKQPTPTPEGGLGPAPLTPGAPVPAAP